MNRIRGLLAEFGVVLPQSPKVLRERLTDILKDASNEIASMARLVMQRAQEHRRDLDEHIEWCDQRFAAHNKDDEQVQRASQLRGIGPITASALVATVGDFKQFPQRRAVRCMARAHAEAELQRWQDDSRRNHQARRHVLAHAAEPGREVATVALANKNARIQWAVMSKGLDFDPSHVSRRSNATTGAATAS